MTDTAAEKAEHFLRHETEFRMGVLPTEQSHLKTVGLAETAQQNPAAAVRMIQAVDLDTAPAAGRALASPEFATLCAACARALAGEGRIILSGCGATGRVSILLEAAWRRFWQRALAQRAGLPDWSKRIRSVMTGGDYALVRSVESFEDYIEFGRQQMKDAGIGPADVLVAVTEGGETSSVIGTAWEGIDAGAEVFFVFNNPADILAAHVQRSREVIEDGRITKLDLSCGPMAVAGSTRMQATTLEILVVGAALETALRDALRRVMPDQADTVLHAPDDSDYRCVFERLLGVLAQPAAVNAIAGMAAFEAAVYAAGGAITYLADATVLDILTDTTERAPTFMLPPFRRRDDSVSPRSWAFVKNPLCPTPEAWRRVYQHPPRCLAWTAEMYRKLGAVETIVHHPPPVAAADLFTFTIGNEDDPSRYAHAADEAVLVLAGEDLCRAGFLQEAAAVVARPFPNRGLLVVGPQVAAQEAGRDHLWHVPADPPPSPLELWQHLAVKLVFNTLSTVTMAIRGRLVSNWMVHAEATNKKLIDRGSRLIAECTGLDYAQACHELYRAMEIIARRPADGTPKPSPAAFAIERIRHRRQETRP